MIELNRISAGYGSRTVLKDVSVTLQEGTLTSIIGVNGCGKSTLLKTILGLVPIRDGCVVLDGKPLEQMRRQEIARSTAYLSQGSGTPDMTVEQLVLHGRFPHLNYPRHYTQEDRALSLAAMEQTGIAQHRDQPLYTLSGGMRQTAYIAMALAQDTKHILLDEPTTYLDIRHQLEIMKLLRSLADSGKAVAAVMHDLPLAFTFSDRILLINNATAECSDAPRRIDQAVIQKIFGVSLDYSETTGIYSYRYPSLPDNQNELF